MGIAGDRWRQFLAFHHAHDAVNAGADATVVVVQLEAGHDVVFDDALRHGVRKNALEAVADLNVQLAVILRHHQQHAVVDAFAAELPRLLHAHRVLLDGLGLRARQHQHRDLRAFACFKLGERLLECAFLLRGQRAREVGDARLERRDFGGPCEQWDEQCQ